VPEVEILTIPTSLRAKTPMTSPPSITPSESAAPNPYASPQVHEPLEAADDDLTRTLRAFSRSMRSLTILSFFLGSLPLGLVVLIATAERQNGVPPLAWIGTNFLFICLTISGVLFALGISFIYRWTIGIWILLLVSYIALAGSVILILNGLWPAVIFSLVLAAMIVGAHQLLVQARKLRAHGIPLSARPEDLAPRENI
jgi:hypothetical protein